MKWDTEIWNCLVMFIMFELSGIIYSAMLISYILSKAVSLVTSQPVDASCRSRVSDMRAHVLMWKDWTSLAQTNCNPFPISSMNPVSSAPRRSEGRRWMTRWCRSMKLNRRMELRWKIASRVHQLCRALGKDIKNHLGSAGGGGYGDNSGKVLRESEWLHSQLHSARWWWCSMPSCCSTPMWF
jgi:hypothetical protein